MIHRVTVHPIGDGFRAACTCGWRTRTVTGRTSAALAAAEHRNTVLTPVFSGG